MGAGNGTLVLRKCSHVFDWWAIFPSPNSVLSKHEHLALVWFLTTPQFKVMFIVCLILLGIRKAQFCYLTAVSCWGATVLTVLCALPLHPSLLPWLLATTKPPTLFLELTNYAGLWLAPGSQQPLPPQHWDYKHYFVFSVSSLSSEAVTQITTLAQKHSMTDISPACFQLLLLWIKLL